MREQDDLFNRFAGGAVVRSLPCSITVNTRLTTSFSTHHHLNLAILDKYREVDWFFAVYEGIELQRIYRMKPDQLAFYFDAWDKKYRSNEQAINNPKIPLKFVEQNGNLVYERPTT